ncbi:hypothetical protein M0Q97_03315 [Candidatus Dojkabacteria bacterium]|jgi:hypothetical protein|nr:hypothetical protein [Candidatus Dojkabacteria bacterium]
MEKICRICGEIKNLNDFHKKCDTKDGHRTECKTCIKEIQKKYKEADDFKEKRIEYDKVRYNEKREEILEHKKEYHIENREKILKEKKDYRKKPENIERAKKYSKYYRTECKENFYKYRNENPHIIAWRSILYSTLNRLDTKKQGHTIDMLGYSALELKEHIESQFTTGMTWDNYGEWQIDHIIGVINFDKNTDVSVVCALSNLRPLWMTTRTIDGIVYDGNLNRQKFK